MITIFLILPALVLAYDMLCPHHSQRHFRIHGLCVMKNDTKSVYTCLEDVNTDTFIESCSEEEDVVRAGEKYIIRGASTSGECSTHRYQPVPFYKTSENECIHKSAPSLAECTSIATMEPELTIMTPDITEPEIKSESSALRMGILIAVLSCLACAGVLVMFMKKYISYEKARKMSSRRELTDELYIRIIGHWRSLKSALDSNIIEVLFPILVKNYDLEKNKNKSLNDKQDEVLYSLLNLGENKGSVTKRKRILMKQYTLRKLFRIVRLPVKKPLWHRRSIEICRRQLLKYTKLLENTLDPVFITDDFLQSFIFDLKQYKEIMTCYTQSSATNGTEVFLEHLLETLNKGSFECLLTQLAKYKSFSELVQVLSEDLVQASLKSRRIHHISEAQDVQKGDLVRLSVKTDTAYNGWVDTALSTCFEWLIEKFAMYPSDKLSSTSDVVLIPMVDDVKGRLIRGITNGALTRFLEIIFDAELFQKLPNNKNLKAEVSITLIKNDRNNSPALVPSQEKRLLHNIITLNKKFMEEDFKHDAFSRALKEKGDNSFLQNMTGIDEKEWFFQTLETKMDKKFFSKFFKILEKNNICSDKIKRRLLISRKVLAAEARFLPDKLMENFSALVSLVPVMDDFKEICIKRDIYTSEYFALIEKNWTEDRLRTGILVEMIKSEHRDAMLALVESLFINDNDSLASDILYMNPGEIQQGPGPCVHVFSKEECTGNGLLFVGEYEICF